MSFTRRLKEYARQQGIPLVGATAAHPFTEAIETVEDYQKRGLMVPFVQVDDPARYDPRLILPGAKTVVAVGLWQPPPDAPGSGVARFAHGYDYHHRVTGALEKLGHFITKHYPNAGWKAMADTGPLVDRTAAWRAGLGWVGHNCLLHAPGLGSWVSLGELVTDVELEPDVPVPSECHGCDACRAACPTGALVAPGRLDASRCLSYLTQTKGWLPVEFRHALGVRIYGCDTCQEVCPVNRALPSARDSDIHIPAGTPECLPTGVPAIPGPAAVLGCAKGEFAKLWGHTAFAWRGRQVLRRNAAVALGNLGDPAAVPVLQQALADPNPLIRGHVAWALGRIGGKAARQTLERVLGGEPDTRVGQEIRQALSQ